MRSLVLACVLGALLLPGCTFSRAEINDSAIPTRVKADLKKGVTTETQLVASIGTPPGQVILLPNQKRLLVWSYGQSKTEGLTLIVFNSLKTNVAVDTAIFLVGASGVVEEAWVGDNCEDVPWEWWAFGD